MVSKGTQSDSEPIARLGGSGFNGATRAYGFAHFGKSLFWYSSEILFAYFLTEISHISPLHMGYILAVGLLSGSVADIVFGSLLKKVLSKTKSAAKLQVLGAVLSGALLVIIFMGAFVPTAYKLPYAVTAGLLFRCAYALYDLPQNAILSLATFDQASRTRLASMRLFFSGLAAVVVAACVGPLLVVGLSLNTALRYPLLALILGVIALLSAAGLDRVLRSVGITNEVAQSHESSEIKNAHGLSPEIWVLIIIMFLISGTISTFSKVEPYYASYVLKSALWGGIVIVSASTGMALSQPLWAHLSMRSHRLMMFGICGILLLLSAFSFILWGHNPVWGVVCALCFGAANGGLGMVLWASFGDQVAEQAKGHEGLAYGLFTASAKISLAVSGLVLGQIMNGLDYQKSQSDSLMALMTIPTIFGVALALILYILWVVAKK